MVLARGQYERQSISGAFIIAWSLVIAELVLLEHELPARSIAQTFRDKDTVNDMMILVVRTQRFSALIFFLGTLLRNPLGYCPFLFFAASNALKPHSQTKSK